VKIAALVGSFLILNLILMPLLVMAKPSIRSVLMSDSRIVIAEG
jgi:hypothetical protein